MLIVLMYHRVNDAASGKHPENFRQHLSYLSSNFPIVRLGESTVESEISVALTFDDAFFDFYNDALPILESLKIPATLGVPVKYIVESTDLPAVTRLSVPFPNEFENDNAINLAPFCTWKELKRIAQSEYVDIASHSFSHPHMDDPLCDLDHEIIFSKKVLEDRLDTEVKSFIYPYGDMTRRIHNKVKAHYPYAFRIGSATNKDFSHPNQLYYRIDAEKYWPENKKLEADDLKWYERKYLLNRLRRK